MRQGRGPELTGWLAGGCLRGWGTVRAGLKEATGASWSRTRVKRRERSLGVPTEAHPTLGRGFEKALTKYLSDFHNDRAP